MIVIIIGLLLTGAVSRTLTLAQEDEYNLADTDVFGKLRRPLVKFSHAIHSDNLMDTGCGICHHNPDNKTGELVYIEGEELSCRECHEAQKENHKPALREAFHGSCTVCHRDLIKTDSRKTGPTTCGGCHKRG
jgi:hypothetical protein